MRARRRMPLTLLDRTTRERFGDSGMCVLGRPLASARSSRLWRQIASAQIRAHHARASRSSLAVESRKGHRLRGASRRRSPRLSVDRLGRAFPCCGERAPRESRGASPVSCAAQQNRASTRRSWVLLPFAQRIVRAALPGRRSPRKRVTCLALAKQVSTQRRARRSRSPTQQQRNGPKWRPETSAAAGCGGEDFRKHRRARGFGRDSNCVQVRCVGHAA
jgi:hypothetical protein